MILVSLCNLPWDTFLDAQAGVALSPARRTHLKGTAGVDRLLGPDLQAFREHESIGGSPANAALAWVRLGGQCVLVGPTGADAAGERIRAALRGCGAEYVEVKPRPQRQAHSVAVGRGGTERIFVATLPRVSPDATWERDPWDRPGWTLTSTYELGDAGMSALVLRGLARARERGHALAFDFADRHFVAERRERIDAVLALRPEVVLCGEGTTDPESLAPVVLVSRGPDGVTAHAAGRSIHRPAPPVEVRDTTGAGDALLGGFLWSWAREGSLEPALDCGLAAAAEVLSVVGAHLPHRSGTEPAV